MVIVLEAHSAITPAGRPVAVPMPVAPVVTCVIFVNLVFTQMEGVEEATDTVFLGVTVIIPSAFTFSHPPVRSIE